MAYENRKWIIINVSDITDEMISSANQSLNLQRVLGVMTYNVFIQKYK